MQEKQKQTGVVWFTNNLRAHDNLSLEQAAEKYQNIFGLYCLDPCHFEVLPLGFRKTEKFRAKFLLETLDDLQKNLRKRQITLFVIKGKPEDVLPQFCKTHQAIDVYHQQEWTSEEKAITEHLMQNHPQLRLHGFYDQMLFSPEAIAQVCPTLPNVFTDFRKKVEKFLLPQAPLPQSESHTQTDQIPETLPLPNLESLGFDNFQTDSRSAFPFRGGETSACERIENYFWKTRHLATYKETRNGMVGTEYSSKLSPWLANGSLSVRQVYAWIEQFENEVIRNQDTYWLKFELLWREYFKHFSMTLGNKLFQPYGLSPTHKSFKNDIRLFKKWTYGQTSDDFVNAHMTELYQTGWMSNRGRQNVANYLTVHLQVDWRWGAAWFESLLLDYDVHSNYCNWLYNSQIGNDPRQRTFNIRLQAERYDPEGKFRKTWLENY